MSYYMILITGLALQAQMLDLGFLIGLYANDVGFDIIGSLYFSMNAALSLPFPTLKMYIFIQLVHIARLEVNN